MSDTQNKIELHANQWKEFEASGADMSQFHLIKGVQAVPEYSEPILDYDLALIKRVLDNGIMLHRDRQNAIDALWRIQRKLNEGEEP